MTHIRHFVNTRTYLTPSAGTVRRPRAPCERIAALVLLIAPSVFHAPRADGGAADGGDLAAARGRLQTSR